ncbi:MAG: hypothetical protein AAFN74_00345 [Myxococcota bacterium]
MLDHFENMTNYMLIGIVIIVAVAQFNRLVGSSLAILFWAMVAVVGYQGYQAGGALRLLNLKLSLAQFLLLCGTLAAVQGFGIYSALRRQRNRDAYRAALEEEENREA